MMVRELHNNMYYACINTQAGIDDNWQTDPGAGSSYWQPFTINGNAFYDLLMANKAYVKELSSEEVVIFDGGTIVAGMTSGKGTSGSDLNGIVTNKGNVRIWAGGMQNEGDLTSAPFTVTDTGVLTSGTTDKIILDNGTIYFVVNGTRWKLGITNNKPDWINEQGADQLLSTYTLSGKTFTLNGSQIAKKDNIWYETAALTNRLNGFVYVAASGNNDILYKVGQHYVLLGDSVGNVGLYKKLTFQNGVLQSCKIVGVCNNITATTAVGSGSFQINVGDRDWVEITNTTLDDSSQFAKCTYAGADHTGTATIIDRSIIQLSSDARLHGVYILSHSLTMAENDPYTSQWMAGSNFQSYEIDTIDQNV